MSGFKLAIDGPAGSGKSTISKLIAKRLGWTHIDTGAMYRAVTLEALELGIDPVHFGIILTFNLCIGICTPPVGSALFVGCSVSGVKIDQVIKPLLPIFGLLLLALLAVTFIPEITLFLPSLLLGY